MFKKSTSIIACLIFTFLASGLRADILDVGTQTGEFTGNTRGYFFVAPVDFIIEGALVVTDASSENQDVEIIRLNEIPPLIENATNDFDSLFRAVNIPGADFIPTNDIFVAEGDVIGVLGSRGADSINSYQSGPYMSSILGNAVELTRLGMQFDLRTTPAQDIWTETVNNNIGRVQLQFRAVPEPASIGILGCFSILILLRRER